MVDIERLRRQSRWFAQLTLTLLVLTALVIVVPTAIGLAVLERRGGPSMQLLAWSLLTWAPSVFYLYGLAAIRGAFASFAAGGVFGPAIASGCTRAGAAVAAGATMSAVGVPNLYRILDLRGMPGGSMQHVGSVLHFDTAYLAVGVVGLALILLGRLLARAAELQGEAARLKGELDEIF
ncbi:MAG TPA: hypothetical protein VIL42_01395 [Sphingomicrobium sp.]|jgi:hypothetical protein